MSRSHSIILGIILGAFAAAIGLGVFLIKANADRERLSVALAQTVDSANRVRAESQASIDEANRKLQAASQEVARAQLAMKNLEDERQLLSQAASLMPPTAKSLKGWSDAVSVGLGISLKLPPGSTADISGASIVASWNKSADASERRIFVATSYDVQREQDALAALASSTTITFRVQDHLLIGTRGIDAAGLTVYVLRIRSNGKNIHLLWLRDLTASPTTNMAETILSTINFAS